MQERLGAPLPSGCHPWRSLRRTQAGALLARPHTDRNEQLLFPACGQPVDPAQRARRAGLLSSHASASNPPRGPLGASGRDFPSLAHMPLQALAAGILLGAAAVAAAAAVQRWLASRAGEASGGPAQGSAAADPSSPPRWTGDGGASYDAAAGREEQPALLLDLFAAISRPLEILSAILYTAAAAGHAPVASSSRGARGRRGHDGEDDEDDPKNGGGNGASPDPGMRDRLKAVIRSLRESGRRSRLGHRAGAESRAGPEELEDRRLYDYPHGGGLPWRTVDATTPLLLAGSPRVGTASGAALSPPALGGASSSRKSSPGGARESPRLAPPRAPSRTASSSAGGCVATKRSEEAGLRVVADGARPASARSLNFYEAAACGTSLAE